MNKTLNFKKFLDQFLDQWNRCSLLLTNFAYRVTKLTSRRFLLNFVNDTVVHWQSYKTMSTYIEKKLNNNKPRQKQSVIWIYHYDQSRMFSRCPPLLPGLALSFLAFLKVKRPSIALNGKPITELRSVTCYMGSHSVTCYRPAITPANQAGTLFTYPRGMEGWVDL